MQTEQQLGCTIKSSIMAITNKNFNNLEIHKKKFFAENEANNSILQKFERKRKYSISINMQLISNPWDKLLIW